MKFNITEKQAKHIKKSMGYLFESMTKSNDIFNGAEQVKTFLTLKMAALENEQFGGLLLTSEYRLISDVIFSTGTINAAAVYPREVAKTCLTENAAAIIIYHNHPSGKAEPSQADIELTRQLKKALSLFDVTVLDHIIIAGTQTFSFEEHAIK